MSQATITMDANQSGTAYTSDLSDALAAIDSAHASSSAPALEVTDGKFWLDTSTTPILKIYQNGWKSLFTVGSTNVTTTLATVNATTLSGANTSIGVGTGTSLDVTGALEGGTINSIGSLTAASGSTTGNWAVGGTLSANSISVSGNVDGRDIAVDGAKLDGIAAGANNYTPPQSLGTGNSPTFNNLTANGKLITNTLDNRTGSTVSVTANLSVSGSITATSNITAYSDISLKSDIKTIDNALDKIMRMRGCEYIINDEESVGVIAQEMEEILPQVVVHNEDTNLKSVAYGNMVAVLIEGMKEQQAQIEDLKARIKVLEK